MYRRFKFAFLMLCGAGLWAVSLNGADWLTHSGDPQRTGWQQAETTITKDNVKDFQLLWKLTLPDNQQKALHSLMEPLIIGRVITNRRLQGSGAGRRKLGQHLLCRRGSGQDPVEEAFSILVGDAAIDHVLLAVSRWFDGDAGGASLADRSRGIALRPLWTARYLHSCRATASSTN